MQQGRKGGGIMNAIAPQHNRSQIGSPTFQKSKVDGCEPVLAAISSGKTVVEAGMNRNIFLQGERADSVFYLKQGTVKLAVTSEEGKDAIFALAEAGELFGESCLAGQSTRMSTASALTDCTLIRID